jgi:hypothetical protein
MGKCLSADRNYLFAGERVNLIGVTGRLGPSVLRCRLVGIATSFVIMDLGIPKLLGLEEHFECVGLTTLVGDHDFPMLAMINLSGGSPACGVLRSYDDPDRRIAAAIDTPVF